MYTAQMNILTHCWNYSMWLIKTPPRMNEYGIFGNLDEVWNT